MYQVKYLDLDEEFFKTHISADTLIDIVDKHNLKVRIFYEFGVTPEKRSAAFGQLMFRSGPLFTNSAMWYSVCEQKKITATTYPLIKKETQVFQNRYSLEIKYLFAPFV